MPLSTKRQRFISVGDTVLWRGRFGKNTEREARIESIELCKDPEEDKYGRPVREIHRAFKQRCIFTVNHEGHTYWAYGYQII